MKKWTQAEADAVERGECGWKDYPTGDYTLVKRFSEDCSFCAGCIFEAGRVTNGKYVAVDKIGSEKRKTYFFKGNEGLFVRAGCWFSDMESFKQRVREVHAGTRHEREYLKACELAEMMLEDD